MFMLKDKLTWIHKFAIDIGCAEGGLIHEFIYKGIETDGIEISLGRAVMARINNPRSYICCNDIADMIGVSRNKYGIATMVDVIEHIADKRTALEKTFRLLKKDGILYITFPTKYAPFAGHQQNLKSQLRYLPWISILPEKIILILGKLFKENVEKIIVNKANAISDKEFIKLANGAGFKIEMKNSYVSRPIFKIRYGLPTIKHYQIYGKFLKCGSEYILRKIA